MANQSAIASAASARTPTPRPPISNTASEAYPYIGPNPNLYPSIAVTETADTPQPVRFVNVDQIMIQAESASGIPTAIDQITDIVARPAPHQRR